MKLIDYLKQAESKTFELKRDLSPKKSILKTISEFSNTSGGTLLIGIEDDRTVVGLANSGIESGTFVRVGSTNRRSDDKVIQSLARYSMGKSFDEEPVPEYNSEAIDLLAVSELFSEIGRNFRVTIFTKPKGISLIDKSDSQILGLLKANPDGLSTSELPKILDVTSRTIRSRLSVGIISNVKQFKKYTLQ